MVPEPSVTPSPFVVCVEYMAAGGAMQRRLRRQVRRTFRNARTCLFSLQRVCTEKRKGWKELTGSASRSCM